MADLKKLLLKLMLDAIENKVVELVDLLNAPAGEYAPRARRILNELVDMVLRWIEELDRKEDEPTNPRIQVKHVFSAPKPPPIPRAPQKTMEIDLRDLEFVDRRKEQS